VTSVSGLEIARQNALFSLRQSLKESARQGHRDAYLLSQISVRYRLLALVALLADADRKEYARLLALSGQTDVACRSLGAAIDPRVRMTSRSLPFEDALAAGDLDTARELARLSPDVHDPRFEYEDDFLRVRVLQVLLLEPDGVKAAQLFARWEAVLEGDYSPSLELTRVLIDRSTVEFERALAATIASRQKNLAAWRKTPQYRLELDATDGAIWVQGLAYLRMAELRGLPTEEDYEAMPSLARVTVGAAAPPPGAWMNPD
jgi:hypothetical protein